MTQTGPERPMDEQALLALEAMAGDWLQAHDGMPLEMLDGFYSALVVGPGAAVGPAQSLDAVVGRSKVWADAGEMTAALKLLIGFWNHIVWRIRQPLPDPDDDSDQALEAGYALLPLIGLPQAEGGEKQDGAGSDPDRDPFADIPRDFPVGALWASGFLHGMSLRSDDWARWLAEDEDLALDIQDLSRLAMVDREEAEAAGLDWQTRPDLDERWELMMAVPGLLQDLDELRRERAIVREPIRRDPVPGRNAPCPCGSGKKYKKCCAGGTDRSLH